MARKIVAEDRVKWPVNTFMPCKVPGPDSIYLICLQNGLDLIIKYLIEVYRDSVAMGHISKPWRDARVVIIPKPSKEPSTMKSYRPISPSSFMLKTFERFIDKFQREGILTRHILEIFITLFQNVLYGTKVYQYPRKISLLKKKKLITKVLLHESVGDSLLIMW